MKDEEEILEAESLELRISEMKSQFQQSYEVFMKAHEELSKISFDPDVLTSSGASLGPLAKLETKDVNEIVHAGSIDDCILKLRSKITSENEEHENTFPDVTKLLKIMSGLQVDIESLTESQNQFSKLTDDVNQEMVLIEKRLQESVSQLDDLVVDSADASDSSHDECCEEEETFGSDSLSD